MPSDIPKAREKMERLSKSLRGDTFWRHMDPAVVADEIDAAVVLMHRDRPLRRAPRQRRTPTSEEDKRRIKEMERTHQHLTLDEIGRRFGTSGARVSEIINDVKNQEPSHLPATQRELDDLPPID